MWPLRTQQRSGDHAGESKRGRFRRLVRHPTTVEIVSAVIAAIVIAMAGAVWAGLFGGNNSKADRRFGWYPQRTVYRCRNRTCLGADHVVFNSYLNTPSYTDERAFFDARLATESASHNRDPIRVQVGDIVVLRGYVNNAANADYTGRGHDLATGTRFKVVLPDDVGAAKVLPVYGQVTADNARPRLVGDSVKLTSDIPFRAQYVFGSAHLLRNGDRVPLPDTIVSDGALIGYKQLDGRIPGCFCAAALIELHVRIANRDAAPN